MSLKDCFGKNKFLKPGEKKAVSNRAEKYKADGMPEKEAEIKAIEDVIQLSLQTIQDSHNQATASQPTAGDQPPGNSNTPPTDSGVPEASGDPDRVSGIKKALAPEEMVDETEIDRRSTQEMLDRGKEQVDNGDVDPRAIVEEIVNKGARALQPNEVAALVYYKTKLDNQYDTLNQKLIDAVGDPAETLQLKQELAAKNQEIENYYEMSIRTAYEQSLAFRLRKMLLDNQYNLQTQINQYKAENNGEIPADVEALFIEKDKELKKANEEIDRLQKELEKKEERAAFDAIDNSVNKQKATRRKKADALIQEGLSELKDIFNSKKSLFAQFDPKEEAKRMHADDIRIVKALGKLGHGLIEREIATVENVIDKIKEYVKEKFGDFYDVDKYKDLIIREVKKIRLPSLNKNGGLIMPDNFLRDLVANGADTIEKLTSEVMAIIKPLYPNITERQVRDAITKYGKTLQMSQDDISKMLRKIKRIGRLRSQLEDVRKKLRPLRSGLRRDTLEDEERRLIKELKELMKDLPISEEESEAVWRTALEAVKTRLKNQIKDLQDQIDNGKKTSKKKGIEYDAEANELVARRDAKRKELEDIEGKPEMSDEQKVRMAMRAAEKSLNEYERQYNELRALKDKLDAGTITKEEFERKIILVNPQRKVGTPVTDELKAIRDRRDAAKNITEEFKNEIGVTEKKALDAAKKAVNRSTANLLERLRNKDFEPKKKKQVIQDDELHKALLVRDQIKAIFDTEQEKNRLKNRSSTEKAIDIAWQIAESPKSFEASLDFSAPFRQGLLLMTAHPILARKAWHQMFGQSFSERKYQDWQSLLKNSDIYPLIRNSILFISTESPKLRAKEEQFSSNLPEKIPFGIGKIVRGSNRAYSAFLNVLRVEVFANFATRLEENGVTWENNPEAYKAIADFINNATMRSNLGKLEGSFVRVLSAGFFSPRAVWSRFNLLANTLIGYSTKPKAVRMMIMRDILTYMGALSILKVLASNAGADTENDPRSSDFCRLRFGDTRYDLLAGFQPIVRFIAQFISGERKSTDTGKILDISGFQEGYKPETRMDLIGKFARSKASPFIGMGINWASGGKDMIGNDVTVSQDALRLITPLIIQDINSIYQTEGITGPVKMIPSVFGVGVMSYPPKGKKTGRDDMMPDIKGEIRKDPGMKELRDIKTDIRKSLLQGKN